MKKLMVAAAAALTATIGFSVESSNIVGYQTKTTVAGFNFVAPTFKNISASSIPCQDITLSGDNAMAYVDSLQILDEGGAAVEIYLWTADGWVDDMMVPCTKNIQPGEGVLISTLMDDVTITFSGAVGTDDLQLVTVAGFNFVGNATPVAVAAQDITLSGANAMAYVDSLQILDEGGAAVEIYLWTAEGWVDDMMVPCSKILQPGDGVLISTLMDDVEINIPSAL